MRKILITGGSGFIGRNLAETLASSYAVLAPSSRELDLLNEEAVRQYLAAKHFDVIVHSATTRSSRRVTGSPDLMGRNCRMFFNLVRNDGLFGKMIHFGSGAEYHRIGLPGKVKEEYFDTHVPLDAYGFSKYVCAKYIERSERLVDLRLFGVFGRYEDYTVRFISNACCRVLKGLPIVIRQNVIFDYLYTEDLAKLTAWFIEHDTRHKAYNVCSGMPIALTDLASLVAEISGRDPKISVSAAGLGSEYTGDNSRLLGQIGNYQFRDMRSSISELYLWYRANTDSINPAELQFDG